MKAIFGALAAAAFTPLMQPASVTQLPPENTILQRAASTIQSIEPRWHFIGSLCTCQRLMKEEVGVAAGVWEQPGDGPSVHSHSIDVLVYTIANSQAASDWIESATKRLRRTDGWTIDPYNLGDGGYTARFKDRSHYEINFRKGRFLAVLGGESKIDVQRFAAYLLSEMREPSPNGK